MSNPDSKNFNPGGIEDRYDSRDYQWSEVGGGPVLNFDWDKGYDVEKDLSDILKIPNFKLKVKDQGPSYSCGGQSWGYLAEVLEALATGSYEPRSAKYMYAQTWVPGGGSRGRDNADIFVNQGVAKESVLTSYQNKIPPSELFMEKSQDITDLVRMDARLTKASAYAQVGTDINSVAAAMENNSGVILGLEGANNGTWLSAFPKPPSTVTWRHWIYAGKAREIGGIKYIGVLNSWGDYVGEEGWQLLSEDYFKHNIFSAWTHILAPSLPQTFNHLFLKDIQFGDSNGEVTALQTALQLDGEFPKEVPTSGYFGDITRKALLAFQFKYKIITSSSQSNNGKSCGPKTRGQLNLLFA